MIQENVTCTALSDKGLVDQRQSLMNNTSKSISSISILCKFLVINFNFLKITLEFYD